jgi:glycosyltransferase involved in cell wall biosynthesis
MSELRILQVLPALNAGGVERVTLDMVTALHQIYPTTYVASEGGSLLPELEQRGGIHLPLPLASKNPFQMARNAHSLVRLIRFHSIQAIHARSRAPAWSALWAARWAKIPFITTYHGAYASSNLAKAFYNSVMARGDRVIAISEFIAKHIQRHYPTSFPRVRLIHEGIDTEEFNPPHISQQEILDFRKAWDIPPTAIVFLLPGRITRIKGQTIFIDALRRLSNPHVVGVILGQDQDNSSYPAEVRLQCRGLPIRLIPHISRPRIAYAAADFIVCASLAQEAFGRVTAEAGSMERVSISTNHGATVELCQHAKTGFLTPPGDARALADAMTHAMKMSPEDYQTMGKAARAHICENFSLKRMCSKTIELYKELIR